ncbi:hypothetical protein IU449_10950 [Nocardia higoensis]|uniref:Uncharacterized protein n=1 Tax=Nocardia higoensis TaxID=228599 RepID=A0ABS0DA91_9NOCA|nr:hypothetical protein [Nocardia higoensis]MBF6355055.1 hypothetical protein [Nocardia higoensis]
MKKSSIRSKWLSELLVSLAVTIALIAGALAFFDILWREGRTEPGMMIIEAPVVSVPWSPDGRPNGAN